ncbi:type VI secretion system Vgr family protein [Deminuibacter soli]|uniref:Type IV secretion protein Rhs n=1 Tax=Deminuibacter soli TaxID=2291815 RepID=A0A3E1NCR7_9BACT|nr:phage baseplate assembly protein V [Deminuibacter soli]RFM25652.1 type IV secretion protein Rhs [Deminuibacter soli]
MNQKLKVNISIEGTAIPHFSTFSLKQQFNQHHIFQLRFNHDQMGEPGMISLEQSKDFMGKNLTIEFGLEGEKEQTFTGKITRVELSQSHGYHGLLIISGYSPTILIDRGPDLGSYLNKDLAAIVRKATEDAPSNDLSMAINPTRTAPVDYIIQYRESDYAFINRLSAEYHEWFFYDGIKLNFGKPGNLDEVDLLYGRDVQSLQYGMSIAPLKYNRFAYSPKDDQLLQSESKSSASGVPDLVHAVNASNQVYGKVYNQPTAIRVSSKSEIDAHVSNESKAIISELLKVQASSDNPQVKLGCVANIGMSLRTGIGDFSTESLGKFLVTAIAHEMDGTGHYYNTFEAVVSDTEKLPVHDYIKPNPDLQLADVLENDDPQKQGRIKVKFKWQCSCNDATEWLRVVSPNAGNGDTGGNRGFFVIPEKGDQVVIAFEEGNIARPVVLGSVFSGKTANSGGFTNSNTKALNSRAGSTLTFDDGTHALKLQTSAANTLDIKEQQGEITITAAEKIVFTTGKSSITMTKDGDIMIQGVDVGTLGSKSVSAVSSADPKGAGGSGFTVDPTSISIAAKEKLEGSAGSELNLASNGTLGAAATGDTNIQGAKVNLN